MGAAQAPCAVEAPLFECGFSFSVKILNVAVPRQGVGLDGRVPPDLRLHHLVRPPKIGILLL